MIDFFYSLFTGRYFSLAINIREEWYYFDNDNVMRIFRTQKGAIKTFLEKGYPYDRIEVIMVSPVKGDIKLIESSQIPRDKDSLKVKFKPISVVDPAVFAA